VVEEVFNAIIINELHENNPKEEMDEKEFEFANESSSEHEGDHSNLA